MRTTRRKFAPHFGSARQGALFPGIVLSKKRALFARNKDKSTAATVPSNPSTKTIHCKKATVLKRIRGRLTSQPKAVQTSSQTETGTRTTHHPNVEIALREDGSIERSEPSKGVEIGVFSDDEQDVFLDCINDITQSMAEVHVQDQVVIPYIVFDRNKQNDDDVSSLDNASAGKIAREANQGNGSKRKLRQWFYRAAKRRRRFNAV